MPSEPTFRLRPARVDDYDAFRQFFLELAVDDPVPTLDGYQAGVLPFAQLYASPAERVGYVMVQVLTGVGYVRHVVVAPEHRGRGLGREMMEALADQLRRAGCEGWCLNVKEDNLAARRLYERVGMSPKYESVAFRLAWAQVEALPDAEGAAARELTPADDARVESFFGLPTGQLASQRRRPNVVLVGVTRGGGELLGFASFDPTFPGAFPFRVTSPELARPLLEALAGHARARPTGEVGPAWRARGLQVVVEDDPRLSAALAGAGAEAALRFLHYEGRLTSSSAPH